MDEMRVHRLDERTADRLLSGIVRPDDAPPGYTGVAHVLESAGSPGPTAEGTAREAATVASMQAAVLGHLVPVPEPGGSRKKMLSKIATIKAAGVAAAVVLGGGTAAAAAGSLPAPAQNAASHVFSTVGIDIPNGHGPNAHSNGHANGHASGTDSGSSTGPNSNALPGLCNAASHNGTSTGHPPGKSTVFSTLVCTGVSTPGQSGTNSGGSEGTAPDSTEPTTPSGENDSSGPPTSTPASGTAPVDTPDGGSSAPSPATTEGSHSHSG